MHHFEGKILLEMLTLEVGIPRLPKKLLASVDVYRQKEAGMWKAEPRFLSTSRVVKTDAFGRKLQWFRNDHSRIRNVALT
jgi:hypothetical protein